MKHRSRSLPELLFPLGIPLAWLQLVADWKRFFAAIIGVTFGVTLMMYQMGLYDSLQEKVVFPHRNLKGDLIMVSKNFNFFYSARAFTRRRLMQARSIEGVTQVAPLYLSRTVWQLPHTRETKEIFVFGIDPTANPFTTKGIADNLSLLTVVGNVLYDAKAARDYGPIPQMFRDSEEPLYAELGGSRVTISGLFEMGVIFEPSANVVLGVRTFNRIVGPHTRNMINIGVITVNTDTSVDDVRERINKTLPGDVKVLTRQEFIRNEQQYWSKRTPIGFVITAGMIVAMIVGSVIVYQILYTDVNDHLSEYATLKAIGIKDSFFMKLVIQEAGILLVFGFVPGLLLTSALYLATRVQAYMPIYMTWSRTLIVFFLSFLMCIVAGGLATRRLRSADPAEVF